MSESLFIARFLNIHRSGVLTALAWLVPQESAARERQSRRVLCTPYNHAPCHFMQSHIRKVHVYLAVTCHPHFWQNDQGLLRATAVTPEGRPGMSDVSLLSGISGLSFDSSFLSPLMFFLPSPLALSVLSFFC